jgi:hypothetical protein
MKRFTTLALLGGACAAALAAAAAAPVPRLARLLAPLVPRHQAEGQRSPDTGRLEKPLRLPTGRPPHDPRVPLAPQGSADTSAATSQGAVAVTVTVLPAPDPPATIFAFGASTPNPASSFTQLRFRCATTAWVRIAIFSITGQRVAVPVDGEYAAGDHSVPWQLTGSDGTRVPAGVYMAHMTAGSFSSTRKLILTP